MKHFILLFFATTLLCQGQIINFPDPNFKNKLLNHSPVIDTNGDDEIQESEAEAFSSFLDLSQEDISDLTGIEYFVNITRLDLWANDLASIDLTHNISISYLDVGYNQLTELDLSNNIELWHIDISNNQLTNIYLPNTSSLQFVFLKNNQLTTIDFPNEVNPTNLNIDNNQITQADFSTLTELMRFYASNNELTEIDLSNQTNLIYLAVDNNLLTNLSIENCFNLRYLKCNDNLLSELSILTNKVQIIDCSNNLLTDLTINPILDNYWQTLNCSGNLLTNLDLSNSSIGQLDCSDNPELETINWRTGWNYKFKSGLPWITRFQNLPNLTTVCLDSAYNQELIDFILAEVGHSVDFYNNETCDALTVNENNLGELTITPNPAENSINIKANTQINQIEIYNELGQLVQSNVLTISTRQTDLDFSALRHGLYFVKVADENGNATIKKVIKE